MEINLCIGYVAIVDAEPKKYMYFWYSCRTKCVIQGEFVFIPNAAPPSSIFARSAIGSHYHIGLDLAVYSWQFGDKKEHTLGADCTSSDFWWGSKYH